VKRIPQGRYTKEFRQEAVRLVLEQKLSWAKAAEQLSLPTSTLANWVKAYNTGKLGEIGNSYRPLTEIEIELARVKKENATLKMECEILKKAAAYFARESLPGTRQ
jgi:transposase-like protein